MGYLGRRIGLSQDNGDSNPGGAGGAVGGGILDLFAQGYFERQDKIYNAPGIILSGLKATGGIISDYGTAPGDVYRAHVFTSTGSFDVTATSVNPTLPDSVEYLVVAGGGGGGSNFPSWGAGGGGAGGFRTNLSGHPLAGAAFPASVTAYPVVVGAGGAADSNIRIAGNDGTNSSFGPIISTGGGGGAGDASAINASGRTGGSGGGGNGGGSTENGGAGNTPPFSPSQGFPGGGGADGASLYTAGGGGGGAGQRGQSAHDLGAPTYAGGYGGAGSPIAIETATAKFYAGGGGGGTNYTPGPGGAGGNGGGGKGGDYAGTTGTPTGAVAGTDATGGGGGGNGSLNRAENGGSGIVVVRYKIASVPPTLKASGGVISFFGGKTIHAFINSGDFNNTSGANLTGCEVIILGGGGGGNVWQGGGGGAGRLYRNDDVTLAPGPQAVTIGAGGAGGRGGAAPGIPVAPSGSQSVFNSVTMPGGGGGATYDVAGATGGSGGGGSYGGGGPGPASPGNVVAVTNTDTPSNGAGNAGGAGTSPSGAGGGGGAGGVGTASAPGAATGGPGGLGIQLPSTFQDPLSSIGFPGSSGGYWVAGGGGGSSGPPAAGGGGAGAPTVPVPNQGTNMPAANVPTYEWAGAGSGVMDTGPSAPSARTNSGSGGGGAGTGAGGPTILLGGSGGSGIVIIAYPS